MIFEEHTLPSVFQHCKGEVAHLIYLEGTVHKLVVVGRKCSFLGKTVVSDLRGSGMPVLNVQY